MGMKIPHRIFIKAKVAYEVVYVDRFDDPTIRALCRVTGDSRQILLLKTLKGEALYSSLLHEILHAIEFEFKLPIPHKLIYRLETILFRILKLNGWLDDLDS